FVPEEVETGPGEAVYQYPRATLPRALLSRSSEDRFCIAVHPEFLADFIARNQLAGEPEGEPFARYRRIAVGDEDGTRLEAVERKGYRGFIVTNPTANEVVRIVKAQELWRTRRRLTANDA